MKKATFAHKDAANNINIRPAFKNEKAEFEYSIRKQWQEEYGYKVDFEWQAASEYFTGNWKILLDGEVVGEILRETNSGQFVATCDGAFQDWDDLNLIYDYFTGEWQDSDANPANVDTKELDRVFNPVSTQTEEEVVEETTQTEEEVVAPRYKKDRKGAGNPNPKQAHEARRKGDKARQKISLTIDADTLEKIDAMCAQQGVSRSEMINQLLVTTFEERGNQ